MAQVSSPDKISAMMITCEVLDARMLDVLRRMMAGARLKTDRIVFQNHMESYYSFMLRQPEELWAHGSVLLRRENGIRAYCMECNKRTEPKVVFIEERIFPLKDGELLPEEESLRQELSDRELLEISREVQGKDGGERVSHRRRLRSGTDAGIPSLSLQETPGFSGK